MRGETLVRFAKLLNSERCRNLLGVDKGCGVSGANGPDYPVDIQRRTLASILNKYNQAKRKEGFLLEFCSIIMVHLEKKKV